MPWVRKGTWEHFSYITYLSLFLCYASHFSRAQIHHNVTCRKVSFERNEVIFYQNRKPLQPRGLVNMFSVSLRGLRCQKGNVNFVFLWVIVQNTDLYNSICLSTYVSVTCFQMGLLRFMLYRFLEFFSSQGSDKGSQISLP